MATRRPAEEIARLGDRIYERDIRREVEDSHDGDFVAIDVESGSWPSLGASLTQRSICGGVNRMQSMSGCCGSATVR